MTEPFARSPVFIDAERASKELRIRPHIYIKLVKSFTLSLAGKLQRLNEALATDDRDQMRMVLHEIKGTGGNLRLYNILGPESLLHMAVKAGESSKILAAHLEALRHECERLQAAVNHLPDSPPDES